MFSRLVQKELMSYLLDFRFVVVFALCVLLSVLSVYVGGRRYARQLREYSAVTEAHRHAFEEATIKGGVQFDLFSNGYRWSRRPEALSPVVYGLSGTQGRETVIRYQEPPIIENSFFATDPIHALFEVLDLAFIVEVILSLCVLLFTYDAICGEKEEGTLRLYASFPVARSTLALAKLVGTTVAVLAPFVAAWLLVCAVLALSSEVDMQGDDWMRMAALMGVFAVYLAVFAAFGLWMSGLTHRRGVAFLGLLVLWTVWIFVVPNLAVDVGQHMTPVGQSIYDLNQRRVSILQKTRTEARAERQAYFQRNPVPESGERTEAQQQVVNEINDRWQIEYYARLGNLHSKRYNQMRRQQQLVATLSAISPLSAASFVSMDLARTGLVQQERTEDALKAHIVHLNQYIRDKVRQHTGMYTRGVDLGDFPWFVYRDNEKLRECFSRNVFYILNLILLAILGFAGAYVAILRYDVR